MIFKKLFDGKKSIFMNGKCNFIYLQACVPEDVKEPEPIGQVKAEDAAGETPAAETPAETPAAEAAPTK